MISTQFLSRPKVRIAYDYKLDSMSRQLSSSPLIIDLPLLSPRNATNCHTPIEELDLFRMLTLIILNHEIQIPIIHIHRQCSSRVSDKEMKLVLLLPHYSQRLIAQADNIILVRIGPSFHTTSAF